MGRRPIIWGLILFGIGAVGWVFSVVLAVVTLGELKFLTYIFGYLFILSLPVAIIWEVVIKLLNRKQFLSRYFPIVPHIKKRHGAIVSRVSVERGIHTKGVTAVE